MEGAKTEIGMNNQKLSDADDIRDQFGDRTYKNPEELSDELERLKQDSTAHALELMTLEQHKTFHLQMINLHNQTIATLNPLLYEASTEAARIARLIKAIEKGD